MSWSSSDARADALGRVVAALAVSVALHAALVALIEPAPFGAEWGRRALFTPGAEPLRARLLPAGTHRPGIPEPGDPGASSSERASPPRSAAPGTPAAERPAGLPVPAYFVTRELDVRPGIMVRVHPEYPEEAVRRGVSGSVVIRLFIDEQGEVDRVEIVSADPPGLFEDSAIAAFRAARFTPGMLGGRPVKVQMVLEVRYGEPSPAAAPGEPGRAERVPR